MHAQSATETTDLRYLDAATLRFERNGARLRLFVGDECCYPHVTVLRAFPLSQPQRYLSVRDGGNSEIGIIIEPTELDQASRSLLDEELARRYIVPIIDRVVHIRERFGTVDWTVETDHGPRSFTTRNLRENSTQPAPGRYILSDVDNNRYDVRDIDALDAASQGWLLRHL